MRKHRQLILDEGNLIIEENGIEVYQEGNNIYFFEGKLPNLNYFFTCDYLESVSALTKLKNINNFNQIWDIEITKEMKSVVNYGSSLYWLSGGDIMWGNGIYNIRWDEVVDIFLDEYIDKLIEINIKCSTLSEVRDELTTHFNLPTMYEFGLEKGIIK